MLVSIRQAHIYAPEDLGVGDILLGYGKILQVAPRIDSSGLVRLGPIDVVDGDGLMAVPGMVDQHVHFLGAGGGSGPGSRIPEISGDDILRNGITTAVGLLGMDHVTRALPSLYAKARTLEHAGLSTLIYTGSFVVPSPTLTGSIRSDLMLIDKVVGVKVAVADATASTPSVEELTRLANDVFAGGLLGGKAGILHIHLGHIGDPYPLLASVLDRSGVPPAAFVVCHVNYSSKHLKGAQQFAALNTYLAVDSTLDPALGRVGAIPPAEAITALLEAGVSPDHLILQSDANGSRAGLHETMLATVRSLVEDHEQPLNVALRFVTVNPATALALAGTKGSLVPGGDADVILIDRDFQPRFVFARGAQKISQVRGHR
jgi:beta-aspartyl-dipeptidase (metallo-type)